MWPVGVQYPIGYVSGGGGCLENEFRMTIDAFLQVFTIIFQRRTSHSSQFWYALILKTAVCFHVFQFVEDAATDLLPNVLCEYLYTLSGMFTDFYTNCKVSRHSALCKYHLSVLQLCVQRTVGSFCCMSLESPLFLCSSVHKRFTWCMMFFGLMWRIDVNLKNQTVVTIAVLGRSFHANYSAAMNFAHFSPDISKVQCRKGSNWRSFGFDSCSLCAGCGFRAGS